MLYGIRKGEPAMLALYFRRKHTDRFVAGNLLCHDAEGRILLRLISPEGEYDGLFLCFEESIYRIDENTQYLNHLKRTESATHFFSENIHDCWSALLQYAKDQKRKVSFLSRSQRKLCVGNVLSFDSNSVSIQQDNPTGKIRRCRKEAIGFAFCDTEARPS